MIKNLSYKSYNIIIIIIILVLAFSVRYYSLVKSEMVLEGDEAIVALMARHINQGISKPVFVYGQDYMGSLEAYTSALMFKIFGENDKTLKYSPLMYSLFIINPYTV